MVYCIYNQSSIEYLIKYNMSSNLLDLNIIAYKLLGRCILKLKVMITQFWNVMSIALFNSMKAYDLQI